MSWPVSACCDSGRVTGKFGILEDKDDLKRRIEAAAHYAPLDQLAFSPQCGITATKLPLRRSVPSCGW